VTLTEPTPTVPAHHETGVRLAVFGLAVQVSLNAVLFFTSGMAGRQPVMVAFALLVGAVVAVLLARSFIRRSRIGFLLGVGFAVTQSIAWLAFVRDDPVFATSPPLGWAMVIVGLLISWRQAWGRTA
jgi:hypothetical protein